MNIKEKIIEDLKQKAKDEGLDDYIDFMIKFAEPIIDKHLGNEYKKIRCVHCQELSVYHIGE